jgi:hypothetical protein
MAGRHNAFVQEGLILDLAGQKMRAARMMTTVMAAA